ncbi:MAG: phosphate signaling complex protein PhoU [Anaeromusa sp.]|uniref:phosphate signaling complex protein PhoU n=1 Tax=Anaeromusa sp. TaxID=1872520 RepID=UPI002B2032C2|nr:phosphate signaling complex protein PhoU [Anaeromusa sp.]MEA4833734.1 phosphate signaling complex protein PhoU [Anaeromusa sp.]
MNTTRHNYDYELQGVRNDILQMGQLVITAIERSIQALVDLDMELACQVIQGDDAIDELELLLEERCVVLIARQQPLAKDLRILSTGLKISTDLERIGDHAFDIAKIAKRLGEGGNGHVKPLLDIPRMAGLATQMLRDALTAYVNMDVELADKVCQADDEVDALYNQLFRELLTYMLANPAVINDATQLIFVARYLERVADHTTNIAEWVIYLQTGQRLHKN